MPTDAPVETAPAWDDRVSELMARVRWLPFSGCSPHNAFLLASTDRQPQPKRFTITAMKPQHGFPGEQQDPGLLSILRVSVPTQMWTPPLQGPEGPWS